VNVTLASSALDGLAVAHVAAQHEGGTTFHFVVDGIHAALERARVAAGGRDVRLDGGVGTVRC
jgi:hypothetical protein